MVKEQNADQVWQSIQELMKNTLSEGDFELWFKPIHFSFTKEKNEVLIAGPDQYFCVWFKDNFLPLVAIELKKTFLRDAKIRVVVKPEPEFGSGEKEISPPLMKIKRDMEEKSEKNILAQDKERPRPLQPYLPFLPTPLCRTTFFRPVPRASLRSKDESFNHPPIESGNSTLIWHGPDCGIKEEDILLYLQSQWVKEGERAFSRGYSEILDALNYKRRPNGKHHSGNYLLIKEHISRITKVSFMIKTKKGAGGITAGGEMHIMKYTWDDHTQKFTFFLDPEFARHIASGMITGLHQRHLLEKDISKALHRFICSHKQNDGHYHILDIALAINMDLTNPTETLLRMIRKALTELKKINFLERKSGIKNDILHWYRVEQVFSGPKLLEHAKK